MCKRFYDEPCEKCGCRNAGYVLAEVFKFDGMVMAMCGPCAKAAFADDASVFGNTKCMIDAETNPNLAQWVYDNRPKGFPFYC